MKTPDHGHYVSREVVTLGEDGPFTVRSNHSATTDTLGRSMVNSGNDRRRRRAELAPVAGVDWTSLFGHAPVAMFITDSTGCFVEANQAFMSLVGYERRELLALSPDEVTLTDDLVWSDEVVEQMAADDLPGFEGVRTFRRKNGSLVNCRVQAYRFEQPPHADPLPAGSDDRDLGSGVSTPRESGWMLRAVIPESAIPQGDAERHSELLALSSETMTLIDTEGRVLAIEGFSRPVLGYPAAFWNDHTILDIVDEAERSRLYSMGQRVTQIPGSEVDTEVSVLAADGTTRTMTARIINCLDKPAIGALVLVTRDVTRYRSALDELQRRSGLAEQIADAQTRLLATVSHELRNPLHAVRGMAELLAAEALPPQVSNMANSLVRQLDSLAGVTNDLLDAAQVEVVPADVRRSNVALREMIGDAVDLCRTQVRERPITVVCSIDDSVPQQVLIDSRRLRQILANLLGNAAKFTVAGTIELRVSAANQALAITVRDTGVGIPETELADVLEPFRVGSTAGSSRGAGLGLSIVSRMVAALGGSLELTSEVGVGTQFDLSIPFAPAEQQVDVVVGSPGRELTGTRVLVVEDNVVNQQLARAQLQRLGMSAHIVSSGEDAIAALCASPADFDVVVLDEQLPGMSGTETVRAIRELPGRVGEVPVVGMSASTSQSDRARFLESGMDEFIAKPASLDDIRQTLTSVLEAPPASPLDAIDAAVLDRSVLEQLADEIGADGTQALMRTFLAELPQRAETLTGALRSDVETARRVAHTLKSSSLLVGLRRLSQLCDTIERSPTDATLSNSNGQIRRAISEADAACHAWLEATAGD